MTSIDLFLPAEPTVLLASLQMPASQEKERAILARYTSDAIQETNSFRNQGEINVSSSSDLAEAIAEKNPMILDLWLPEDRPRSKADRLATPPQIFPEELSKMMSAAGRELLILIVKQGFYWGINAQNLVHFAPISVVTNQPVPNRLWEDFMKTWFRLMASGLPIQGAFDRTIEGLAPDYPEEVYAIQFIVNEELARDRALTESSSPPVQQQESVSEDPFSLSTLPDALTPIAGGAHSDHPAKQEEKDWLGYRSYAQIISSIIKDPESEPPLSIAIIGPWGQGKSSLMRMVQNRIQEDQPPYSTDLDKKAGYEEVRVWTTSQGSPSFTQVSYPTVWFNPWEYQSSEQIWSGMAHAIIHQLVGQLPPLQQEKFWLALHLERIDKQAIRQRVYRDVLIRALPWMLVSVVILIGGLVAALTNSAVEVLAIAGVTSVSALGGTILTWVKNWRESLKNVYDEFLKPPEYGQNLGIYHAVNEDLDRVFRLLVSSPAVIFIDDLDRCSPKKVVEVVEAINLIMNAQFRQKCYFVIGMDAEMVAAALDVAYKDMKGKFPGKERNLGSVGWYFLDKFIQVPVVLPTMSHRDKEQFLDKLFEPKEPVHNHSYPQQSAENETELREVARELLDGIKSGNHEIIERTRSASLDSTAERELDEAVLALAYQETEDQIYIQEQVRAFADYLDPSPRSMKRFANLLRFYTTQQQLRQTKSTVVQPIPFADTKALAKWLIITLRWPMMVRWLQWRDDLELLRPIPNQEPERILHSRIPEDKAQALDQLIRDAPPLGMQDSYWADVARANPQMSWLADRDCIRILTETNRPEEMLIRAFECDVW